MYSEKFVKKIKESLVILRNIDVQELKQRVGKVKESIVALGKIEQDMRKGVVRVNRFMKETNYIVPKVLIPVIVVPIAIKTYNTLLAPATVLVALNKPPIFIPPYMRNNPWVNATIEEKLIFLKKARKKSALWLAIRMTAKALSDKEKIASSTGQII
jgi:hypothetical protein